MADFIRPEVRNMIWRWRDVIGGLCLIGLGLWLRAGSVGFVAWLGLLMIGIGALWAIAGIQLARFRGPGDGAGIVQVAERRLSYFGPTDGGFIDVEDLTRLELNPKSGPSPSWVLTGVGGQRLSIPVNAAGSDALFDVFATLPEIKTQKMIDTLTQTPDATVIIWTKTKPVLH